MMRKFLPALLAVIMLLPGCKTTQTDKVAVQQPPAQIVTNKKTQQEDPHDYSKFLNQMQDKGKTLAHRDGVDIKQDEYYPFIEQLYKCWQAKTGARFTEDAIVKIRISVSPERKILSAIVIDQWRYSQDSYFRAAADQAVRALHSPQCEILNLPPNKYDDWKDIIVTYDPQVMN